MEVYDLLIANHKLDETQVYPKNIREFREVLERG